MFRHSARQHFSFCVSQKKENNTNLEQHNRVNEELKFLGEPFLYLRYQTIKPQCCILMKAANTVVRVFTCVCLRQFHTLHIRIVQQMSANSQDGLGQTQNKAELHSSLSVSQRIIELNVMLRTHG